MTPVNPMSTVRPSNQTSFFPVQDDTLGEDPTRLALSWISEKAPNTESSPVPIVLATLHQAKKAVCLTTSRHTSNGISCYFRYQVSVRLQLPMIRMGSSPKRFLESSRTFLRHSFSNPNLAVRPGCLSPNIQTSEPQRDVSGGLK